MSMLGVSESQLEAKAEGTPDKQAAVSQQIPAESHSEVSHACCLTVVLCGASD